MAYLELQKLRDKEDWVCKKEYYIYKAYSAASAQLSRLEKVCEKLHSKEYLLYKQGI